MSDFRIGRMLGCLAFVLGLTTTASADEAGFGAEAPGSATVETSGLQFNLNLGYLLPIGRFAPGERIGNTSPVLFPFSVDIGYRFNREWFVGVHGLYAFGVKSQEAGSKSDNGSPELDESQASHTDTNCPDCSHNLVRVGLFAEYRLQLTASVRLALGLGSALQFFNTQLDQELRRSRRTTGWELLEVRAATEWPLAKGLDVGPMLSLGLGTFWRSVQTCANPNQIFGERGCSTVERPETGGLKRSLDDAGLHVWFAAGVRAVILP